MNIDVRLHIWVIEDVCAYFRPYIPPVLESGSSPKPKDPFSFVSDLTGIGETPAKT